MKIYDQILQNNEKMFNQKECLSPKPDDTYYYSADDNS